jgi:hypothetical protein
MAENAERSSYNSNQHNEGGQAEGVGKDDDRMDAIVDGLYKNTNMSEA